MITKLQAGDQAGDRDKSQQNLQMLTEAGGELSITTRAWLEINPLALRYNIKQLKLLLSPTTELMAVIKANAYGHGTSIVAQTALVQGVTSLAVATIAEGRALRETGIEAPILVLGAVNTPQEIRAIAHYRLQPNLSTPAQAQMWSEIMGCDRKSLLVHINVDTGMSRLGTSLEEVQSLIQLVQALPGLELVSIYSHLATADDLDPTIRKLQHERFQCVVDSCKVLGLPPHVKFHLANSAGTLVDKALHYDRVRVGLALYGLYPAPHLRRLNLDLRPVMTVRARVTLVKPLAAGTGVSYGYRFVAPQAMLLAVVGIGYADGVPRLLSNKMQVLIRGQLVPQVGNITMDQLMLDVSAIPDLQVGEVVTLIGRDGEKEISADDWAEAIGTISWEIICGFQPRLPRVVINSRTYTLTEIE